MASLRSPASSPNQRSGTGSSLLRTPPTPATARAASLLQEVVPPVESCVLAMTGLPAYPRVTSSRSCGIAHADPAGPLPDPRRLFRVGRCGLRHKFNGSAAGLVLSRLIMARPPTVHPSPLLLLGGSLRLRPAGSTPCLLPTPPRGDAVGTVCGAEPSNCTDGTCTHVDARFTGAQIV